MALFALNRLATDRSLRLCAVPGWGYVSTA
jgi:hypothetical protein